jgi:hypothetical protein
VSLLFLDRWLLIAALLTFDCGAAAAQNAPEDSPPTSPQTSPPQPAPQELPPSALAEMNVADEAKIDQFADAYLAIEAIHTQVTQELKEAENSAESDRIKAQAETQIIAAVERSGLRLDEFNRIADALVADKELRAKIAARIAERRKR